MGADRHEARGLDLTMGRGNMHHAGRILGVFTNEFGSEGVWHNLLMALNKSCYIIPSFLWWLSMNKDRQYSLVDKLCMGADHFLRALLDNPTTTGRAYPGGKEKESPLSTADAKHSAGLMRVNHTGEICAQALYHGQSLVSRKKAVKEQLQQAAIEEGDHLAWCSQRLAELGSHTSYLNPLWYAGSFVIGMSAGMAGDRWSLGFLAETEKQVVKHLKGHLNELAEKDERSVKIIKQMQKDEEKHQHEAVELGAKALPKVVQKGMSLVSKVMVKVAYWV